jgi:hypothetical protein
MKANLEEANLQRADLRGADLWEANLKGADLRGANLEKAFIMKANLWGANLKRADLRDANLWGANLKGADLRGANLEDANLQKANLEDADLWGADLRGADLRDADLRGAKVSGVAWPSTIPAPIPGLAANVLIQIQAHPEEWDQSVWHSDCNTAHCVAGWTVTLAENRGKAAEDALGTPLAAAFLLGVPTMDCPFGANDGDKVIPWLQGLAEKGH